MLGEGSDQAELIMLYLHQSRARPSFLLDLPRSAPSILGTVLVVVVIYRHMRDLVGVEQRQGAFLQSGRFKLCSQLIDMKYRVIGKRMQKVRVQDGLIGRREDNDAFDRAHRGV